MNSYVGREHLQSSGNLEVGLGFYFPLGPFGSPCPDMSFSQSVRDVWRAFLALLRWSHFQDYLLVKFLPGFPFALEAEASRAVGFLLVFPTESATFPDNTAGNRFSALLQIPSVLSGREWGCCFSVKLHTWRATTHISWSRQQRGERPQTSRPHTGSRSSCLKFWELFRGPCFSLHHSPLVNCCSSEMVVRDHFVQLYMCLWRIGFAKSSTLSEMEVLPIIRVLNEKCMTFFVCGERNGIWLI